MKALGKQMPRALILTSNSLRHIYFANKMAKAFDVKGLILEPKSDYFESQQEESALVRTHFATLAQYEKKYLAEFQDFPSVPLLRVKKNEINDHACLQWALEKDVEIVLLFGTGILGDAWLSTFKDKIVNLHLGHSPRYRGSATLFWPFANDELEFVGSTIHLAESKVDAGAILKIVTSETCSGDNFYDINFKTIKKSIDELPGVVSDFVGGRLSPVLQRVDDQKYCYRKRDFTEDVLRRVMEKYGP
jgi:methionyl-tRNA formyltransferase